MTDKWAEKMSGFCRSPGRFLSGTGSSAEALLTELVRELREDRVPAHVKVVLLSAFCEQPLVLCPSQSVGEETALELMSVYSLCSPKALPLRCHLLLAITSVLLCTDCVRHRSNAAQDFLELLFLIVQDTSELHSDSTSRSLRATACDCLRELEACCPGLLSQHLELLGALRQRESSRLHQAYCELYALVIKNGVYQLAQDNGAGADDLKALLEGDTSVAREVTQDSDLMNSKDLNALSSLVLGPMGAVPTLHTGPDCKELRSLLSSLLEDSYLLTPLAQAALLHKLIELVAMVPGVPPTIFRAQLLRLLGTSEVSLLHTTLLMKSAFTDSLFSAEDEAFLLKRLVVLSQHPLLSTPEKLFYMDCLLHFPENRPIGSGDETLPVLLTPQLATALVPTVFNDSVTMLTRFNLISMVCLENGEEEDEDGKGLAYLYEHLVTLLGIVGNGGNREIVTTCFRAVFLFLSYFGHAENYSSHLIKQLCELYLDHTHLAPQLINLADETQNKLPDPSWTVALLQGFQSTITNVSLTKVKSQELNCHLKLMARVAEERDIPQHGTLLFLSAVVMASSSSLLGNWRLGNSILAVCRCLLTHPSLDTLLVTLADVLQHMATSYRDTDIRDHSRLYYTLLTNLSNEKLAGVLERGTATERDQVKKRTLSCIVAESEGQASILSIQTMEKEILKLVALKMMEPRQLSDDVKDWPLDSIEAVAAYRAQFDNPDFASEVIINCQLIHIPSNERKENFEHLFSIHIHLSLTDDHYEELRDISVPCLFREKPPPIVKLKLKPRKPYPTSLQASAVFTTQDGLTWYSELPDIHISFQQTFCPVPVPPAWGQLNKLTLFNALWQEICTECEDVMESAESLFCCQLEKEELETVVDKHFKPFLVENDSDQDELRVFVFLPPLSHMMLKIRREEDTVNFDIATDNWHLLPHINSFLQEITSQEESLR